jgi:hypothetical protein
MNKANIDASIAEAQTHGFEIAVAAKSANKTNIAVLAASVPQTFNRDRSRDREIAGKRAIA